MSSNPVCLICIDGWGVNSEPIQGDAIKGASTPVMDQLASTYPTTYLAAHGLAVGLPDGLMGNSEVGHLNIGAGRVVYQVDAPCLTEINRILSVLNLQSKTTN